MSAGLLLTACDSSEPRAADDDYSSEADGSGDKSLMSERDAAVDASSSKNVKSSGAGGKSTEADDSKSNSADASCGDKSCSEPATCEDDKCVCPEGYNDVEGDGSKCEDIDECKERTDDCRGGSVCRNEPGGYRCECSGPAYEKDGDSCKCADGYMRDDDGNCAGKDGMACADNSDCESKACEGEICCAQQCSDPAACQDVEGAKCSADGKSCEYPRSKDGTSCDDGKACTGDGSCMEGKCIESKEQVDCDDMNPCTDDSCEEPAGCINKNNAATCDDGDACTSTDACAGGECKGVALDCSGSADVCNTGACDSKTGECVKKPRSGGIECDDQDSCTLGDACKDGACVGAANACGTNATACTPAEVNMCTCQPDFVDFQGRCVPTNDECQTMNPCSEYAVCTDPSNTDGDVTCACKPGFKGDGVECVATDPCATEPCGAGATCTSTGEGKYSCQCPAGQRELGGTCVCDLSGDFALRITQEVQWRNVDLVEDGNATTETFMFVRNSYDAEGKLSMELVDCGANGYEICSAPRAPLVTNEAYAQYIPNAVWATNSMPRTTVRLDLPSAQPGAAFQTGNFAMMLGIKLDDPLGAWPANRSEIGGTSEATNVTNGAVWLDHDNDGILGVSAYAVGPGGDMIDGIPPDPPVDFAAKSETCPRSSDGARYDYAYLPAVQNGSISVQRVKRLSAATRSILGLDGSIDSCDALSGKVVGPKNGMAQYDGRFFSCIRVNGSGESACAAGIVDFLDQTPPAEEYLSAKFQLQRMSAGATCETVRTRDYP